MVTKRQLRRDAILDSLQEPVPGFHKPLGFVLAKLFVFNEVVIRSRVGQGVIEVQAVLCQPSDLTSIEFHSMRSKRLTELPDLAFQPERARRLQFVCHHSTELPHARVLTSQIFQCNPGLQQNLYP